MKYFSEETFTKATKIIMDNWTEKENVQVDLIVNQLNITLDDAKNVYEAVMDNLVSNVKLH